tara:strand:- start:266 stop:556 length:291 start_codon:yes stop_codon:yes gene_type:complete
MEILKLSGTTKRRRRKRMNLYLINDDKHSFDYVIDSIVSFIPLCNRLRAEQIAMITDNTGECSVYSGFSPEIYLIYTAFIKAGLKVEIREYNKKSK